MLKRDDVNRIVLEIDSPGGEADGIAELSDIIYCSRKIKPTKAVVKNTCASAAYWLASACTKVTSDPYAFLGSIGAFVSFYENDQLVTLVSDVSPFKTATKRQ